MANKITIVGIGAGDLEQLPYGIYKFLKQHTVIYVRTKEHPVVQQLEEENIKFISFDDIYEKHSDFESVYEEIVTILLEQAKTDDVTYAVPGHPMVAEKTVQLLLERGPKQGIDILVKGGQSFLDDLFAAVKIDPIEGMQILDATTIHRDDIQIDQHVIIVQVYDQWIASQVKLTLMEKYPDDYEVVIVQGAGSTTEHLRKVPLYELDHNMEVNNLTSVYVPPIKDRDERLREFSTLRAIIAELRGPNGCPWDKEQTHESLKKFLIEEAYELFSAIDQGDIDNMIEELGDVLLQVMLHSQIGEDEGMFTVEDVIESISRKMIHRHPHVFGDTRVENVDEVLESWDELKQKEKPKNRSKSMLSDIEKGLPAMMKAYEYQKKAAKVGFDWKKADEAWVKVKEEMQEFETELKKGNKQEQTKELGDLLFAIINVSRLLDIHPEEALAMANDKFFRRFSYVEQKVQESGKPFSAFELDELDQFWDEAKVEERS